MRGRNVGHVRHCEFLQRRFADSDCNAYSNSNSDSRYLYSGCRGNYRTPD